jgi:hypothetical protein
MDKRRNWLVDVYLSYGNALCDLSNGDDDEHNAQLTVLIKNIQKHVDLADGKLTSFLVKFYLHRKSFGKLWKLLLKQIEDKPASQQREYDDKLLHVSGLGSLLVMSCRSSLSLVQLYRTMDMKHLITYQQRLIVAKYPSGYVLF